MAKRRIVRRTTHHSPSRFDEALWPINVALAVLGGFLGGVVVVYVDIGWKFWLALAAIPLAIGAAMLGARQIDNRLIKRALQFSLIAAVAAHIAMFVVMERTRIFGRMWVDAQEFTDLVEEPPIEVAPTYIAAVAETPPELSRPQETDLPQPPSADEAPRQPDAEEALPSPAAPWENIEIETSDRPNRTQLSENFQPTPRQNDAPSQLSRQTETSQPQVSMAVDAPDISRPPSDQAAKEIDAPDLVRKQTDEALTFKRSVDRAPADEKFNDRAQLARKQEEFGDPFDSTAVAALPRRLSSPAAAPNAQVQIDAAPAASRSTQPDAIAPANTLATRQATASPLAEPRPEAPTNDAAAVETGAATRALAAPEQPQLAQNERARQSGPTRSTTRPDAQTSAVAEAPAARVEAVARPNNQPGPQVAATRSSAPEAERGEAAPAEAEPAIAASAARATRQEDSPAARESSSLPSRSATSDSVAASEVESVVQERVAAAPRQARPAPSQVVRQAPEDRFGSAAAQRVEAEAGAMTGIAAQSPARARAAQVRTMTPSDAARAAPLLARATAETARAPTNVDSPALAPASQDSERPGDGPSALALSKGNGGVAGGGRSPNADRAMAAGESPALVASGAAQRAEASQALPEGAALAPSAAARIPRAVADADRPSATIRATAEAGADSGLPQVASIDASAAVSEARSNSQASDITAAQGVGDFDLGPTRIVSENDAGRASGGGQPQLAGGALSAKLQRADSGGPEIAGLPTDTRAETLAAPVAEGGGAPLAIGPRTEATVAARAADNGAMQTGPTVEAGETTSDAVATAAEAHRQESSAQPTAGASATAKLARSEGAAEAISPGASSADLPSQPTDGGPAAAESASLPSQVASQLDKRSTADGAMAGSSQANSESAMAIALGGELARAASEAAAAASGAPRIGGGTNAIERSTSAPAFAASARAEEASLAGAPSSSGMESGADLAAQGARPSKVATGVESALDPSQPLGALAAETPFAGGEGTEAGLVAGRRASGVGEEDDTPSLTDAFHQGAPRQDLDAPGVPGGMIAEVEAPGDVGAASAVAATPGAESLVGGINMGPISRGEAASAEADVSAPEGAGGLGAQIAADAGISSRNASRDSEIVLPTATRYSNEKASGLPNVSTAVVSAKESFRQRAKGVRKGTGASDQPGKVSPQTEAAIENGLTFLARHQFPDGSWRLHNFGAGRQGYVVEQTQLASDGAATALAVLSFQGAGYNHREHKHQAVVLAGIQWLLAHQKENGDLYVRLDGESNRYVWLYSHSIAALAVCEAYGMTQDPALRGPAQRSLDFIVASQNDDRGGWRYSPGLGSDTSVSGWMMMALKSGELAGLNVPEETYRRIDKWLDKAQESPADRHLYRYNPYAPNTAEQRHGLSATPSMTAVGLLMRLYTGWQRDDDDMQRGADYLLGNLPSIGVSTKPQRDTYYWYYGTQLMYHMGGEHWEQWNAALHPLLIDSQVASGPLAGSWDPRLPLPDRWGPQAGRIYVTTMNLLSLEVHYRHLPLYEATAK